MHREFAASSLYVENMHLMFPLNVGQDQVIQF